MVRVYSCNHSESPLFPLRSVASIKIRFADKIDRPASRSKNWKFTTSSLFFGTRMSRFGSCVLGAESNECQVWIHWRPFHLMALRRDNCLFVPPSFFFYYLISFVSVFGKVFWLFSSFFFFLYLWFGAAFLCSSRRSFIGCGSFTLPLQFFSSFFCILFPISSG